MKKILALALTTAILVGQCVCVKAAAEDTFAELEGKLPVIEELMALCEEKGIF